jgi:hypothetical protein
MKQTLFHSTVWTMIAMSVVLGLMVLGCSSGKEKLLTDVSGVWDRGQDAGTVQFDLTGQKKTLELDGKSYSATIDTVNMDRLEVDLKVQNGDTQPEMWSVRQVWDDNGVDYKLVFDHEGQKEHLAHKTS